MTDDLNRKFADDHPKRALEDDRLGYAPFAERLTRFVINLDAPNGYVVGLHGIWGSGKTTTLNFLLKHLEDYNEGHKSERIIHIDFRPLIVSGHQDLIAAFFKLLSEALGSTRSRQFKWLPSFRERSLDSNQSTEIPADNAAMAAAAAAISALINDPSGVAPAVAAT